MSINVLVLCLLSWKKLLKPSKKYMAWWKKSVTWLEKLLPLTWWQFWLIILAATTLVRIMDAATFG